MRLASWSLVTLSFGVCAAAATAQPRTDSLGPRTLIAGHVLCTDLPVVAVPIPELVIGAAQRPDGRLLLSQGDVAIIPGGSAKRLAVGQRYVARHLQGGANAFPLHQQGYAAVRTSGILTVTAVDERFALATVDYSCDALAVGDYLETYTEPHLPAAAPTGGTPQFADRARVLFGVDRHELLGDGDLMNFDRGTNHGVVPGTRVAIYRDRLDGTPLVEVGEAVVVEPGPDRSKAVVVMVHDVIYAGDIVVVRQP